MRYGALLSGLSFFFMQAVVQASEAREITVSALNVRSGPGTSYSIIGTAHSPEKYAVVSTSGSWIKIWWAGNTGWIHASYTVTASGSGAEITASTLNVRTGPSTSYSIAGTAHRGEVYAQAGSSGSWKQIWFGGAARWVHGDYTRAVSFGAWQRYWPSESELDLFERTVMAEAGGEPYEGQVAVAAVILNRVDSPKFPNTIRDVVYERYQFEAVSNGMIWKMTPTQSVKDACRNALRGWDPSRGALYYFAYKKVWPRWADTKKYLVTIGNHRFYTDW